MRTTLDLPGDLLTETMTGSKSLPTLLDISKKIGT